jgi:mono/diheme cytochrome c family protein
VILEEFNPLPWNAYHNDQPGLGPIWMVVDILDREDGRAVAAVVMTNVEVGV